MENILLENWGVEELYSKELISANGGWGGTMAFSGPAYNAFFTKLWNGIVDGFNAGAEAGQNAYS